MSKARDIADLDFNNPDIDGGNIDGAVIGGTTPAAGTFTGVNVITSSAGDILTLESTSAGNGVGPSINLFRNSSSPADNDLGPAIYFRGENSVGGQHTYANIYSQFNDVTDGSEDATVHHQISIDGTARSVLSLKNSEVSVNEESQNVDFRVESDSSTHAFFVDASNDRVAVGTSSPQTKFHIASGVNDTPTALRIENLDTSIETDQEVNSIEFYTNDGSASGTGVSGKIAQIAANPGNQYDLAFFTYNTSLAEAMRLTENGRMAIGVDNPPAPLSVNLTPDPNYGIANFAVPSGNPTWVTLNRDGSQDGGFKIQRSTTADMRLFVNSDESTILNYNGGNTGDSFQIIQGAGSGALVATFDSGNNIIFNENGGDQDFRVESNTNTHALFVDGSSSKTMFNTNYSADGGVVTIRGTYGAHNASDYRGNNALALTGADPGSTAAGSGINLAFVPVANRGATAVISGENTGTNKEGGAQLRFSLGGGSFPTTQKDMLMLNYNNGVTFSENVGIGTTPTYPLHIYDPTPRIQLHDSSSGGTAYLNLDGVEATLRNNSTNGALKLVTNNPREEFVYINGTAFYSESFNLNNGVQYDFDIDVPSEGGYGNSFFIIAGYAHNNASTYAAHTVKFVATRSTGLATIMTIGDQTSAGGGAWQISKADNTTLRLRKTAGTYVGSGSGFITVIFRNAIG